MSKTQKSETGDFIRLLKFVGFSCTAGIIQFLSFTLLHEIAKFSYWPAYLIALTLSVIWNFTLNRKFTFKSANNVPVAMLKVFGYYLVFTPISTWLGNYCTEHFAYVTTNLQSAFSSSKVFSDIDYIYYIVLVITMIVNMVTEFLFQRFFVFRNSLNTNVSKKAN